MYLVPVFSAFSFSLCCCSFCSISNFSLSLADIPAGWGCAGAAGTGLAGAAVIHIVCHHFISYLHTPASKSITKRNNSAPKNVVQVVMNIL